MAEPADAPGREPGEDTSCGFESRFAHHSALLMHPHPWCNGNTPGFEPGESRSESLRVNHRSFHADDLGLSPPPATPWRNSTCPVAAGIASGQSLAVEACGLWHPGLGSAGSRGDGKTYFFAAKPSRPGCCHASIHQQLGMAVLLIPRCALTGNGHASAALGQAHARRGDHPRRRTAAGHPSGRAGRRSRLRARSGTSRPLDGDALPLTAWVTPDAPLPGRGSRPVDLGDEAAEASAACQVHLRRYHEQRLRRRRCPACQD
jgi:hypothetical protein